MSSTQQRTTTRPKRPSSRSVAGSIVMTAMLVLSACGGAPEATVDADTPSLPTPVAADSAVSEDVAPTEEEVAVVASADPGTEPSLSGGDLSLGVPLPFTGEFAFVGENVMPIYELIAEEVNDSGGIAGGDLALVSGDTEGVVDAGVLAARQLVGPGGVLVLLGPTSLSFTGVRQVVNDSGTAMISPTAGTTELDEAGTELFFRTVPSDSLGGRAVARAVTDAAYLNAADAFESPALMVAQEPAMVSFQEPIVAALEEFGSPAVANTTYAPGQTSYRSEVQAVLDSEPDVIILVGSPADSARVMQDTFQAGYEGAWFVTQDQTTADYVELAGAELVEGIYGLVEASAAEDLLAEFTERLGQEPAIFQTNAYDAINVTALAMLAADVVGEEVTRESIAAHLDVVANPDDGDVVVTSFTEGREALEAGEGIDYQGLSGPVDFDEYGNITAPFAIQQVQDGTFTTVATVPAEAL